MIYANDNANCPYFFYEPNECKKCLLLGYNYSCGGDDCKKRLEKERQECLKT